MKKFFTISAAVAAVLALYSCQREDLPGSASAPETNFLSIPLSEVTIPHSSADTKSSFYDDGTGWTFKWENGDVVNYILTRGGATIEAGSCNVITYDNGGYKIDISFENNLQIDDIVYTFFTGEASSQSDPTRVEMCIPESQNSINDAEYTSEVVHVCDTTVEVLSGKLTPSGLAFDKAKVEGASSTTPPTRKLTFSIPDYNPALAYRYSLTGSSYSALEVDEQGNASVDIPFKSVTYRSTSKGTTGSTSKTLYVKCESGKAATVNVNASGTRVMTTTKVKTKRGYTTSTTYTYTYNYSVQKVTSGDYYKEVTTITEHDEEVRTYGSSKPVHLRNCMPMAGNPVTINKYYANGKLSVSNALSFKVIGSLVEFRTFTNSSKGLGETLQSVSFEAEQPIAGTFHYDLTTGTPDFSSLSSSTIESNVGELRYVLPDRAAAAVPTYMVVAPCTTSAVYTIETDAHSYSKTLSEAKEYKSRTRTIESCNLTEPEFIQN